jgi:hypothetical protein
MPGQSARHRNKQTAHFGPFYAPKEHRWGRARQALRRRRRQLIRLFIAPWCGVRLVGCWTPGPAGPCITRHLVVLLAACVL